MKKKIIFGIAILSLALFFTYNLQNNNIKVAEIIDGDTIRLTTGEYIRLLGINAPEKGQKFYEEAKNELKELLKGKDIKLEKDKLDRDKYGRLLRYVYVNKTLINVELVRMGYVKPYLTENLKYKKLINEAWEKCLKEKLNLCGLKEKCDNSCIGLEYLNWNARGDDCKNLNDEYVVFKNYCNISCNLTNWRLYDKGNNSFYFPEFILEPYKKVIIHSGRGSNTNKDLYWNSKAKGCGAIWNNGCGGDIVFLENSRGELVLKYNYRGFC